MKKIPKIFDVFFLTVFCSVIAAIGALIFIIPQKSFSQKENRALATMPQLSLSSVISGNYFKELNSFYSDQIPMRDQLCSIYSLWELSLGSIEVNGVIPTDDKCIVALPEYKDISKAEKNFDTIYSISSECPVCFYVPARSFDVFESTIPDIYPRESANSVLSLLKGDALEDFQQLLKNAPNGLYYRTDHHWTTDGAYFAYRQICNRLGIQAYSEDRFNKITVCQDFKGTSASRSGLPDKVISADSITLYRYDMDENFIRENHETGQSTVGFYCFEALEGSDKYKTFLGGNYSHLSITEKGVEKKAKLLLIKDSFANSVIPFLAIHFDIEVIDPRYCSKSFLQEQIKRNDVDQILILMGFETLTTDIFS